MEYNLSPSSLFVLLAAVQCLSRTDALALPTSSKGRLEGRSGNTSQTDDNAGLSQDSGNASSLPHPSSLKADFVLRSSGHVTVQAPSSAGGVYTLSPDLREVVDRIAQPTGAATVPSPLSTVLTRDGADLVVSWDNRSTVAYPYNRLQNGGSRVFPGYRDAKVKFGFEGEHGNVYLLLQETRYSWVLRKITKRASSSSSEWTVHERDDVPIRINANGFAREWIYGFEYGNSQYLVAADNNRVSGYNEVRVARLCGGRAAWYEANLTCGAMYSFSAFSHTLVNATFVPPTTTSSSSSSSSSSSGERPATLVVAVRSDGGAGETRVCSYVMSDILQRMRGVLEECRAAASDSDSGSNFKSFPVVWDHDSGQCQSATEISECRLRYRQVPWLQWTATGPGRLACTETLHSEPLAVSNHTPTSIAATWNRFGGLSVFLGQADGIVKEYANGSGDGVVQQRQWTVGGYVARVRTDRSGSSLYALSIQQDTNQLNMSRFALSRCSDFTSCHTCAAGGGAGGGAECGWCADQGRCGTASQCQSDNWISEPESCRVPVKVATVTETESSSFNTTVTSSQYSPLNQESLSTIQELRHFLSQLPLSKVSRRFLYTAAIFLWADPSGQLTTPPAHRGGIWHISESAFRTTQARFDGKGLRKLLINFNTTWSSVVYSNLDKPYHSAMAAVLYTKCVDEKMTFSLKDQASFFTRHFAPALSHGPCHPITDEVEETKEEVEKEEPEEDLRIETGSAQWTQQRNEPKNCSKSDVFACNVCSVIRQRKCLKLCSVV